jgi:hypothetical protein
MFAVATPKTTVANIVTSNFCRVDSMFVPPIVRDVSGVEVTTSGALAEEVFKIQNYLDEMPPYLMSVLVALAGADGVSSIRT